MASVLYLTLAVRITLGLLIWPAVQVTVEKLVSFWLNNNHVCVYVYSVVLFFL